MLGFTYCNNWYFVLTSQLYKKDNKTVLGQDMYTQVSVESRLSDDLGLNGS